MIRCNEFSGDVFCTIKEDFIQVNRNKKAGLIPAFFIKLCGQYLFGSMPLQNLFV